MDVALLLVLITAFVGVPRQSSAQPASSAATDQTKPRLEKGEYQGRWQGAVGAKNENLYLAVKDNDGCVFHAVLQAWKARGFNEDMPCVVRQNGGEIIVTAQDGSVLILTHIGGKRYEGRIRIAGWYEGKIVYLEGR